MNTSLIDDAASTASAPAVTIERMTRADHWPTVDAMLRDYLPWVMREMEAAYGLRFEHSEQEAERHHAAFEAEARAMMAGEGLLLLACVHQSPAAVVALKRIDATTAEVKRLYVRPAARGLGIGRALMEQLVEQARQSGYRTLRLETMGFMRAAIAIYESLGFEPVGAFDGSQAAMSGVAHTVRFMRKRL